MNLFIRTFNDNDEHVEGVEGTCSELLIRNNMFNDVEVKLIVWWLNLSWNNSLPEGKSVRVSEDKIVLATSMI